MAGDGAESPAAAGGSVWLNGELVAASDACVSPFDHGLLTGDGVFETLWVREGVPFAWTRHLERLNRSASAMGLSVPGGLRLAADQVLQACGLREGRLRITLTGGVQPPGSERTRPDSTVIVACAALTSPAPSIAVAVCPWTRNERSAVAAVKTISYGENVVALAWAAKRGAGEAIFANTTGALCEGTGTNVFIVRDNIALTPPASCGCLDGVTRALLLERLGAREADLTLDDFTGCAEAFVTSSTRRVQPVHSIDGRPIAVGETTRALARSFDELARSEPDP